MNGVIDQNEVLLDGIPFPILGPIRPRLVSPFPARVVVGDPTRTDQSIASDWVLSDWRGGLGIEDIDERVHTDRFTWAVAETRDRNKLYLPPLAVDVGAPTGYVNCELLAEFNGEIYGVWRNVSNNYVLHYLDANGTWYQVGTALTYQPTGWVIYRNRLYIFYEAGYAFIDTGRNWTNRDGAVNAPKFGVNFDDKLVTISADGRIYWSVNPDANPPTWTLQGTVDIGPLQAINSMVVYRNVNDEPTLFVGTTRGLYGIDFWTGKAYPTELQFVHPDGGLGMAPWNDGALYIPEGLGVYRLQKTTLSEVGLTRDDGPPKDVLAGRIAALAPTREYLYALLDNTTATITSPSNLVQTGGELFAAPLAAGITINGGNIILAYNRSGWHPLYVSPSVSVRSRALLHSAVFGEQRIWFGSEGRVRYIRLPNAYPTPLKDPRSQYAPSGDLWTGWFDAGFSEIDKLALAVRVRCLQIPPDTSIKIQYAIDDELGWREFSGGGVIDSTGLQVISFGDSGQLFKKIRFRFFLSRSSDPLQTPVLVFTALRYQLLPNQIWGWGFRVDCSKPHRGYQPEELVDYLYDLAESKRRFWFVYSDDFRNRSALVRISALLGLEQTGLDGRGIFDVQVVEVE
jgi:hypothetical protein